MVYYCRKSCAASHEGIGVVEELSRASFFSIWSKANVKLGNSCMVQGSEMVVGVKFSVKFMIMFCFSGM